MSSSIFIFIFIALGIVAFIICALASSVEDITYKCYMCKWEGTDPRPDVLGWSCPGCGRSVFEKQ